MLPCPKCERGGTGPHPSTCTPEMRFWRKVRQVGRCWIWTGSNNGRYGEVRLTRKRKVYAHRLSYEMTWGPLAPGKGVAHRCDTPLCVKPSHLFEATQLENMQDMMIKGRHASARAVA